MHQLVPASPSLPSSSREALVQLGGRGCQGGAQLGGWHGPLAALPCPSTLGSPHWRRPFCSRPPAPHSCSFESPAWEAVDASLCSLFRPLSSHWRQPCSSLGRLINSIINAERKESPRSFLMATHAPEYKRQADRKQGLVPGDAPPPASGARPLPVPSWTTWPHLPGQPLGACEGTVREGVLAENPSGGTHTRLVSPALRTGCKSSLGGRDVRTQPQDGLRTQQACPHHLRAEKKEKK